MTAPSIKEALEHYAHEYCEGWCEQDAGCANFDDCGGCLARRALATFQPDGEMREAIARIIDPMFRDNLALSLNEKRTKQALDKADALIASGLVQNEAGWRTMDSAPKSHNILLFAVTDISDDGSVKNWKMGSGYFAEGYNAWRWENYVLKTYDVQPTHWKPLPAPPIRSARDGGAET